MKILVTNACRPIKWLILGTIIACASLSVAAEQGPTPGTAKQAPHSLELVQVDFYEAIQQRKIDVRVVPNNYSSLTMRVHNVTRTPLKIELPTVFGAVPATRVQAQRTLQMQGVQASLGNNFVQNAGSSQGLGGSLGGPWWGDSLAQAHAPEDARQGQEQGPGDAPQYLMLAPGRFVQAQIPCFCLEYGRPDPNRHIPYVICRLEDLNGRPAIAELLEAFAKKGINQFVAQLAAWHIANDVPWKKLAQVRFPRPKTSRTRRVTPVELAAARNLVAFVRSSDKRDSLAGRR